MHFSSTCFLFIWWNVFVSQLEIDRTSAAPLGETAAINPLIYKIEKEELDKMFPKFNRPNVTEKSDTRTINETQHPFPSLWSGDTYKVPEHSRSKRYALSGYKWEKRQLHYYLADNSKKVPHSEALVLIGKAFQIWKQYIPLTFVHTTLKDKADISISFETRDHGDDKPFDGPGGVAGHCLGTVRGSERITAIIHFDDDEDWELTIDQYNSFWKGLTDIFRSRLSANFFHIAVHEIGHALGLAHSTDEDTVMREKRHKKMFFYDMVLPWDDRAAVQQLYPN